MGMIINPYRFTAPLLLDTYTGATAAYSLRKLRTAYTGYCIEVRRSSDDTTTNIGFVNGVLDESALTTFVGAGDGFVKTWYDQAGSYNAVQNTSGYQPKIVASGTLFLQNNKPAINSVNINTCLLTESGISKTESSIFIVVNSPGTGTTHILSFYPVCPIIRSSRVDYDAGSGTGVSYTENGQLLLTSIYVSNYGNLYINGTYKNNINKSTSGVANKLSIMNYEGLGYNFGRDIQEVILWITDKTSEREGIESNINSFYSIY